MKKVVILFLMLALSVSVFAQKYTLNPGYFESDGYRAKFFMGIPHTRDTSHVTGKLDSIGSMLIWRDSLYLKGLYAWINVSKGGGTASTLNEVLHAGNLADIGFTVTGINSTVSIQSNNGNSGAQINALNLVGQNSGAYIGSVPPLAGNGTLSYLRLQADTAHIITSVGKDLVFQDEAALYYATLHANGRFTGAPGTGVNDFTTVSQNYFTADGRFSGNRKVTGTNGTNSLYEDSLSSKTSFAYSTTSGTLERQYPDSTVDEWHRPGTDVWNVIRHDHTGWHMTATTGSGPGIVHRNGDLFFIDSVGNIEKVGNISMSAGTALNFGTNSSITQTGTASTATFTGLTNIANLDNTGGTFRPNVKTITADLNLGTTSTLYTIINCANTTNITVTLPDPVAGVTNTKNIFYIKKSLSNVSTITIVSAGSATIDGNSSHTLSLFPDGVGVYTDGTNWFILP